jgi:dihydroorotate dehydrogenase
MVKAKIKTQEERRAEVRPIIEKLTELNITVMEPPIKDLFSKMRLFVQIGEKIEVNIPYPKTNQIIEGVLHPKIGKRTWIRMVTPK